MLGLAVTKAEVDKAAGTFARDLDAAFYHASKFKEWLDGKTVDDLVALGYTPAEANTVKSAFSDMAQLSDIFAGAATLAVARDFRIFLKQCWGLGNVPL